MCIAASICLLPFSTICPHRLRNRCTYYGSSVPFGVSSFRQSLSSMMSLYSWVRSLQLNHLTGVVRICSVKSVATFWSLLMILVGSQKVITNSAWWHNIAVLQVYHLNHTNISLQRLIVITSLTYLAFIPALHCPISRTMHGKCFTTWRHYFVGCYCKQHGIIIA